MKLHLSKILIATVLSLGIGVLTRSSFAMESDPNPVFQSSIKVDDDSNNNQNSDQKNQTNDENNADDANKEEFLKLKEQIELLKNDEIAIQRRGYNNVKYFKNDVPDIDNFDYHDKEKLENLKNEIESAIEESKQIRRLILEKITKHYKEDKYFKNYINKHYKSFDELNSFTNRELLELFRDVAMFYHNNRDALYKEDALNDLMKKNNYIKKLVRQYNKASSSQDLFSINLKNLNNNSQSNEDPKKPK